MSRAIVLASNSDEDTSSDENEEQAPIVLKGNICGVRRTAMVTLLHLEHLPCIWDISSFT